MNAPVDARDLAAAAYLDSGRNGDLPILVRSFFALGEGAGQDEILELTVSDELDDHWFRTPFGERIRILQQCECCAEDTREGREWRLVLAESAVCSQAVIEGVLCPVCAESWSLAEPAFLARAVAPTRPEGDLEIVRELIAAIPANDATISKRAAALAYVDDMIDRRVG